jgi:hypothetical protein
MGITAVNEANQQSVLTACPLAILVEKVALKKAGELNP